MQGTAFHRLQKDSGRRARLQLSAIAASEGLGRVPHVRPSVHPDFLSSSLALTNFMRLSLMKAAHASVGGAPCRKSGNAGRKRWAKPFDRFCAKSPYGHPCLIIRARFCTLEVAAYPANHAGYYRAGVAELADAHGSGPCTRKGVGVRVPSSAPMNSKSPEHFGAFRLIS
jgi:hypothetical protein